MAHSRRSTPICGVCVCRSEKDDKRLHHSIIRAKVKERLLDHENYIEVLPNEGLTPWDMGKDGKQWFDPIEHPRCMRK